MFTNYLARGRTHQGTAIMDTMEILHAALTAGPAGTTFATRLADVVGVPAAVDSAELGALFLRLWIDVAASSQPTVDGSSTTVLQARVKAAPVAAFNTRWLGLGLHQNCGRCMQLCC
jgi:hypothetical protein